jgi:hypothetical protein
MEFLEETNEIEKLTNESKEVNIDYMKYMKQYNELGRLIRSCTNRKNEIAKNIKHLEHIIESSTIFASVNTIDGFETLLKDELFAISNGIDKTDYRKYGANYPRWFDLERIVKDVIKCKTQYPGWILETISKKGQLYTLPPQSCYKFTYKTPQGDNMSCDGIEMVSR